MENPKVRKFLFMRYSFIENRNIPVCVEALNKDHAIARLLQEYLWTTNSDWDFVEELDPQHFLGKLGKTLTYKEPS